jgi:methylenetetrahydrofolate dehydrogenase (NADP+) / methenyltetrahydrofolate cyclohydrolase
MCDNSPTNTIQGKKIKGSTILLEVKRKLQSCQFQWADERDRVKILTFEPKTNADQKGNDLSEIAELSAKQKAGILSALLMNTDNERGYESLPWTTGNPEDLVRGWNDDKNVKAIIVQYPMPNRGICEMIGPEKDIDALRSSSDIVPATSEGIVRVLRPFVERYPMANIAVRGGEGFVGGGVLKKLLMLDELQDPSQILSIDDVYKKDNPILENEIGRQAEGWKVTSDRESLSSCQIIVTATDKAKSLVIDHLHSQTILIIDAGFHVNNSALNRSDRYIGNLNVSNDDTSTIQYYTPVPGGVGPIEMAVIAERLVNIRLQDCGIEKLKPWALVFDGDQLKMDFPDWTNRLEEYRIFLSGQQLTS